MVLYCNRILCVLVVSWMYIVLCKYCIVFIMFAYSNILTLYWSYIVCIFGLYIYIYIYIYMLYIGYVSDVCCVYIGCILYVSRISVGCILLAYLELCLFYIFCLCLFLYCLYVSFILVVCRLYSACTLDVI